MLILQPTTTRAHSRRIGLSSDCRNSQARRRLSPPAAPTSHGVFTTPDSKSQRRPPGRLPSGSGYPQSRGNDGNALVSVDLAAINHAPLPARLSASPQAVHPLKAKLETLQADPAKLPRVHSRALNRL